MDRVARELLKNKDLIDETNNRINQLVNEINQRFDDLVGKYLFLEQERLATIANTRRLEEEIENMKGDKDGKQKQSTNT